MKHYHLLSFAISLAFLKASPATEYPLQQLAESGKLKVVNRTLAVSESDPGNAVSLTAAPQDGLAWIHDLTFSEGTIQVELQGKDEPGRSFVGIAFHGVDDRHFDAVYLRPFNFKSPQKHAHSMQYVSLPKHGWAELRQEHPQQYESSIHPAPDPGSWVKLRLEVTGKTLLVYVNESKMPIMKVALLNHRRDGNIALWVGNNSSGGFRNLRVTPKPSEYRRSVD